MKKTLTTSFFGLTLAAASLMGAYQYGDYVYYDYNNDQQHNTLSVVADSNLTLNFITNPYYSPYGYNITDWSTLTVKITDSATNQVSFRDVAIDGSSNSINIGDYMAGQNLFFYVSGSQGTTFTTQQKHIGHQGWDNSTSTPDWLFFDGNYAQYNSQYAQLSFRVEGTGLAPSGQPLPGVAASMLVGGAGLFFVKRKKKLKLA